MSDDIVNKLQTLCHPASEFLTDGKRLDLLIQRGKEAADEIDRLRGEVEALSHVLNDANKSRGLALAEVERLTRERDEALNAADALRETIKMETELQGQLQGELAAALARAEAAERERDWHKALTQSHDLLADNSALKTRAEAAEAKVAKLREALTPFVTSDDNNDEGTEDDWDWYPTLKIFDLRRARTALQETETKGE